MRVALCLLQCASLASLVSLSFSACTVTDTIKGALGSTSDFLSSTTPGSWVTADGLLKPEHKVTAFVTLNFENLKQDMAQGQGEYLTSLSELFGVPQNGKQAFFSYAQSRYQLINTNRGGPAELIALLDPSPGSTNSLGK
ncbi:MAG TPA: DUF3015 family protein [Nitrospira sp.]|nr:DUF3015 family protein [Nitrospira sp.]